MSVKTETNDVSMTTKTPPIQIDKKTPRVEGMLLQAQDLTLRLDRPVKENAGEKGASTLILSGISMHVQPGELVVLTGPERFAKSLLLEGLAGLQEPTDGEVLLDGLDLYKNLKPFRAYIGYISSEPSLYEHLTVRETLQFQARLLLPRGVSGEDHWQRVQEALAITGLEEVANRQVTSLSRLNQRLLSIAVELLNQPAILFADAPAGYLNPVDEIQITALFHVLAQQGQTVIQVTDESRGILMADKVAILAPGGTLAWFGPPEEALIYFHSLSAGKAAADTPFTFEDVLWALKQPQMDQGTWAERFRTQPAYKKYVDDPLHDRHPSLHLQDRPITRLRGISTEKQPPPLKRQASGFKKLMALIFRRIRLLPRQRAGIAMLLAPPLIALSDFLISSPDMLNPSIGDPARLPVSLGLLMFLNMLLSAALFQDEISKERPIYRREYRSISIAIPYLLSKIWLVALLSIYQGAIWTLAHYFASGMEGGMQAAFLSAVTFILVAFIGGLLGLMVSSLVRSGQAAWALLLILIIPQLLLSGSVIPLPDLTLPFRSIAMGNPLRYAFETMLTISGYGRDIAADQCWQLPEAQRTQLTSAQKQACNCMEENIFSRCRFPGIHQFFTVTIEQPKPVEPTLDPILLTHPVQPEYQTGQTVEEYVQEVDRYTLDLEQFQGSAGAHMNSLNQYSEELAGWQTTRSLVIGRAEGLIAQAVDHYGHAFQVNLVRHWLILSAFSVVLVILLFVIQTRKGASVS